MPNTTVPADATGLPAVHRIYAFLNADLTVNLSGLMRREPARASYELRACRKQGIATTWRAEMRAALVRTWAEAKGMQANLVAQSRPAPMVSDLDRAQLALMTIKCAERPTRRDLADMDVLHARIATLTSATALTAHA